MSMYNICCHQTKAIKIDLFVYIAYYSSTRLLSIALIAEMKAKMFRYQ